MQSLDRMSSIIDCFDLKNTHLSLAEITEKTGISKTAAYRIAEALVELGILEKNPNKLYSLGFRLFQWGSLVVSNIHIRKLAMEKIELLQQETGESVHLGIMDNLSVTSVEGLEGSRSLVTRIWIGKKAPIYSTSIGKAILAFLGEVERNSIIERLNFEAFTKNTFVSRESLIEDLDKTRERGYSIDNIENEEGIRCVGAPVFDRERKVVASLSISGPASRFTDEVVKLYAEKIMEAAGDISKRLGAN